ncbi:hypothetical protein [Herbaspirillum huttiense]|uniref:hypothetical protein n=1 Tax=Herbaspirillum huttiense TaxID=863372 RepID=UPI002176D544|nr:hypothetical protein [Herbaspirillum huttiense]UWE16088.1 hypothetical protein NY669_23895 [Herbaspirillum huttiense]
MAYVYRYDNWVSHMRMEGNELKARHWSLKKGSHPHKSLIASEEILPTGKGLFRISFWKNERAMLRWGSSTLWPELQVMQRVREDHPFLQTFTKEIDDCLEESAWLYWKTADLAEGQGWSVDGIPKRDIEVLDFDGVWRRYDQSDIMRPEADVFAQLGFEEFHYLMGGMVPASVFAKSKLMEIDGDMQFVVVITHPVCQVARAYNDTKVITYVFQEMRRYAVDIPLSKCRIFVMDDAKRKFDNAHMAELPLSEVVKVRRRYNKLLGFIPVGYSEEFDIKVDSQSPLRWHASDGALFSQILNEFSIPRHIDHLERYAELHSALRAEKCPDLLHP